MGTTDLAHGFAAHVARLAALEFPDALEAGERAPEFALRNARGRIGRLRDMLRKGPVVLVFYRGAWCPYCNAQLRALQEILPQIRERGASLVAVSPQTPDASLSMALQNALSFEVLSDVGCCVASDYGIVFSFTHEERELFLAAGNDLAKVNGRDAWLLSAPAVFVVDASGVIRLAHVDGDFTQRIEPAAVLAALEAL